MRLGAGHPSAYACDWERDTRARTNACMRLAARLPRMHALGTRPPVRIRVKRSIGTRPPAGHEPAATRQCDAMTAMRAAGAPHPCDARDGSAPRTQCEPRHPAAIPIWAVTPHARDVSRGIPRPFGLPRMRPGHAPRAKGLPATGSAARPRATPCPRRPRSPA